MKTLLVAGVAFMLMGGTALAATIEDSGRSTFHRKLSVTAVSTATGSVSGETTFVLKNTVYSLIVENMGDRSIYCREFIDNRVEKSREQVTLTCSLPDAPPGTYRATVWPSSGFIDATVSLSTP